MSVCVRVCVRVCWGGGGGGHNSALTQKRILCLYCYSAGATERRAVGRVGQCTTADACLLPFVIKNE